MPCAFVEREVVARLARDDAHAHACVVVQPIGASPAGGVALDRDPVVRADVRRTGDRVAAAQPVRQVDVQVRAGGDGRQGLAVGPGQLEGGDAFCLQSDLAQLQFEGFHAKSF
ncbi:hypothetical protein D9M72_617940 [compost metagenome]